MVFEKVFNTSNSLFKGYLNFKTFRGKITLLILISLGSFLSIAWVLYTRNQHSSIIQSRIQEARSVAPLHALAIQKGLNEIMQAQEMLLRTDRMELLNEQKRIWHDVVQLNFQRLQEIKGLLIMRKTPQALDSLQVNLRKFKTYQDDLERFYKLNFPIEEVEGLVKDTLAFIENAQISQALHDEIDHIVLDKQLPVYKSLRDGLDKIHKTEVIKLEQLTEKIQALTWQTTLQVLSICLVALFIIILLSVNIISSFNGSLNQPVIVLDNLSQGQLEENISPNKNELGFIAQLGIQLQKNLQEASNFAIQIGEGNFSSKFNPLSDQDQLGNALIQMRDRLQDVAQEDQKRAWAAQGLEEFTKLLRVKTDQSLKDFAYHIIAHLVKYLNASQGGFFICDEQGPDETYLELIACYAFERRRFLNRKIYVGENEAEGIIGQAYLEKQTIYITDVPQNHTKIISGLGKSVPECVLIVPLSLNDSVEGIIELTASRKLDAFEIEFIERVTENITFTLASARATEENQELLKEYQEQAHKLQAQEEEMRQNNEELMATHEQMRRKGIELEHLLSEAQQKEFEKEQALEAARENQEELLSRQKELESIRKKLQSDESVLRKTFEKSKARQAELQKVNKEIVLRETELKKNVETLTLTQRKLKDTERKLFAILNSIRAGVLVVDLQGNPYFANDKAIQLLGSGITADVSQNGSRVLNPLKVSDTDIPYPQDRHPLYLALQGQSSRVDDVEVLANQQRIPLEITGNPIYNDDKEIMYALAVYYDISDQTHRLHTIEEMNRQLQTNEEELRQSMEELITTQNAMEKEQKELRKVKSELEKNTAILQKAHTGNRHKEKKLKEALDAKDQEVQQLQQKIQELLENQKGNPS